MSTGPLLGVSSEAGWVRYARSHLAGMFPYIPRQPGYNKHVRAAGALVAAAVTALARDTPSWYDKLRLLDCAPVPCGTSRETAQRSGLARKAGYGYCRSHHRYYWGLRLHLVSTAEGMPVVWCLARPGPGEREATAALLDRDRHLVAAGQVFVGDKGFAGGGFERFVTEDLGAVLLRPDRRDENPGSAASAASGSGWNPSLTPSRDSSPWTSTAADSGRGQAWRASRLLALAAAIWRIGAPRKRSLTAYDH